MPKKLVFERYDPTKDTHVAAAEAITLWQDHDKQSPDYQQMFALGPRELAQHVFGVICLDIDDEAATSTPVGYNAATFEFPGNVFETGAMIVNPDYRGHGVGRQIKEALFEQLAALYPDHRVITFANANSEHLNRRCGFRDATAPEVPSEALDLCKTECVSYQKAVVEGGKLCCDTILVRELGVAE